jgi:hypothetical protein
MVELSKPGKSLPGLRQARDYGYALLDEHSKADPFSKTVKVTPVMYCFSLGFDLLH